MERDVRPGDASLKDRPSGPKVLVIDDYAATTETFAGVLRLEGYRVSIAESADAALREMAADPPDAILLDLRMPVVDGAEFLRQVRAAGFRTPVAVLTGDYTIDDEMSSELLSLGAIVCFKPVWLDEVVAITRRLLANGPPAGSRD